MREKDQLTCMLVPVAAFRLELDRNGKTVVLFVNTAAGVGVVVCTTPPPGVLGVVGVRGAGEPAAAAAAAAGDV